MSAPKGFIIVGALQSRIQVAQIAHYRANIDNSGSLIFTTDCRGEEHISCSETVEQIDALIAEATP